MTSLEPNSSSLGVGEEEQGWKRAKGSVTNSRSWQMLAGFRYSKQEPESLVALGISARRAVPDLPQTWHPQVLDQDLG